MEEKQELLFKNKTTYTKEAYIDFLKFHNQKYNLGYIAYTIFWSLIFFFCIIIAFGNGARLQGVVITMVLACFLIYRMGRPQIVVKKEMKSDKLENNLTNTFSFYDKYFEVKNDKGKFNYKYKMIRKAFTNHDFYYLYVTKENAFLISKNTFSVGNADDFAVFLTSKCHSNCKISN